MRGSFGTGSLEGTHAAGVRLAGLLKPGDVVTLAGDLGAGKTAFVQGVAEGLGVEGPVVSPTFNILVVHHGRITLNHFDLYRLEYVDQLEDVDFFGTLESDGASFVEWGDRFPDVLPEQRVDVTVTIGDVGRRTFEVVGVGERGTALAAAWLGDEPDARVSS
jgi:tRNA threonylcarbamoyladenosine biosynthesis protein TsaE